jgi:hypothetical protein
VKANYRIDPADIANFVVLRFVTDDTDNIGPCASDTAEVRIDINLRARISAAASQELCVDQPSISLLGVIGGSTSTTVWSGGTNNFSNAASPTSTYSHGFTVAGLTNDVTVPLQLKALDPDGAGPCKADSVITNLIVHPLPVIDFVGLPLSVSENEGPKNLVGFGDDGLGQFGNFTIGPVGALIGATNPNGLVYEAQFFPTTAVVGIDTVYFTYRDTDGCTNSIYKTIIVNPVTTTVWTVDGAVQNGGKWEVCASQGRVRLSATPEYPLSPSGSGEFSALPGTVYGDVMLLPRDLSFYYIDTDNLRADEYIITYKYTDIFGGITTNTQIVKILAAPISDFVAPFNNCIDAPVHFDASSSTTEFSPDGAKVARYDWDFGPGINPITNGDSILDQSFLASGFGLKTVKLTTFTNIGGCKNEITKNIRVGNPPVLDFVWSNICDNDSTRFTDKSTIAFGTIDFYSWNFDPPITTPVSGPANATIPFGTQNSSGTYKDPVHAYGSTGARLVTLTATTNDGCSRSLTKNVFILPSNRVAPNPISAYREDFNANDGAWIPEAFAAKNSPTSIIGAPGFISSDTSWVYAIPNGARIQSTDYAWWTNHPSTDFYRNNENSAINGPCFDITALSKPMIAFDYLSDMQFNVDGVALQYSTDAGRTWQVLGENGKGIDWHNGLSIAANPGGNQTSGPFGWTGTNVEPGKGWKRAYYNLDMIPVDKRDTVRIRFALGSNDGNPEVLEGFAFDNIYVGEKMRNVLVESFENNASNGVNQYLETLQNRDASIHKTKPSFNMIQYHLNSTAATDPLYEANPGPQDARSFTFGNTDVPFAVSDGRLGQHLVDNFTGLDPTTELTDVTIDRRALLTPEVSITIDTVGVSANTQDSVNFRIVVKPTPGLPTITNPIVVQAVLVEGGLTGYNSVFKQSLMGIAGVTILRTPNDSIRVVRNAVEASITYRDSLAVVAFAYDLNTKMVLQSTYFPLNRKTKTLITGTKEDLALQLYPNPASKDVAITLMAASTKSYAWQIIDQRGVVVKEGVNDSLDNSTVTDISDLANGLYIVRINQGTKTISRKLVVNR